MLSRGEALRPDHASAHQTALPRAARPSRTVPPLPSAARGPDTSAAMESPAEPCAGFNDYNIFPLDDDGCHQCPCGTSFAPDTSSDRRVRSLVTHRTSAKHTEWHHTWRLDHDVLYAAEQRAREAAAAKQRRAAAHAAVLSSSNPKEAVNAASREVIRAVAELPSSPAMGNSSAALPSPAAADAQAPASVARQTPLAP